MRLLLRKPTQTLPRAYAKQSIPQLRMDNFRRALATLFAGVDEHKEETYQQRIVSQFLGEAIFQPTTTENSETPSPIERSGQTRIDLLVYPESGNQAAIGQPALRAVVQVKKVFAGEMMTALKNNVRALHELILHYFEEHDRQPTNVLSRLIITDVYNWFFFDEADFRRFFHENEKLRKLYQLKAQQQKSNAFFYGETAKILRELDADVPVTYLNLREAADALTRPTGEGNRILIPVYKLFSPEYLTGQPVASATTTHRPFIDELLHIAGLRETVGRGRADRGKRFVQRLPEEERHPGSLLENIVGKLDAPDALARIKTRADEMTGLHGSPDTDPLQAVTLSLCITWLGRLLFLKELERQLVRAAGGDRSVQFMSPRHIQTFDDLNELFFEVLPIPVEKRPARIRSRYSPVPYAGSSTFVPSELEEIGLMIKDLDSRAALPLFEQTVLPAQTSGQQQASAGQLPTLYYLLSFLDAYDVESDGPAEVLSDQRPIMSTAALGLVFEHLSMYSAGATCTPDPIACHLTRDTVRRLVLARFSESFSVRLNTIPELADYLRAFHKPDELARVNAVMNNLRILDPAVGSGHFLVSALHELLVLKSELGLLIDHDGRRLYHHTISVADGDLVVTNEDGELLDLAPLSQQSSSTIPSPFGSSSSERHRIQEILFREKRTLIEGCLFGVDSNPVAVELCRLRLWIELVKSSFFMQPGAAGTRSDSITHFLRPLPDLDFTLQTGNALLSRLELDFRIDAVRNQAVREQFSLLFQQYRTDIQAYRQTQQRDEKVAIRTRIAGFKEFTSQFILADQQEYATIRKLEIKLSQSALTFDFVDQHDQHQRLINQLAAKKEAFAQKKRLFRQAVEWRFAFLEVLDEAGNYVGFDGVLGAPPTVRQELRAGHKAHYRKRFPNTVARTGHLYPLYIELGMNLLRPAGYLAYLLPQTWLQAGFTAPLRQWLTTKDIDPISEASGVSASTIPTSDISVLIVRKVDAEGFTNEIQADAQADLADSFDKKTDELLVQSLLDTNRGVTSDRSS